MNIDRIIETQEKVVNRTIARYDAELRQEEARLTLLKLIKDSSNVLTEEQMLNEIKYALEQ